jgi:large subunit ribosomal protein L15
LNLGRWLTAASPPQGSKHVHSTVHLEVSRASETAIEAVEAAGGSVTCVHLNRLALRALLKPHTFEGPLPRRARPPPRLMPFYLDFDRRGYLAPEVQLRNSQRFGKATSEVLPLMDQQPELATAGGSARE